MSAREPRWIWLCVALVGFGCLPELAGAAPDPVFEATACPFVVPAGVDEGRDLVCGYVAVPEWHRDPDGRSLRLAVVILKSQSRAARPDPALMLAGGPGESTFDTYVAGVTSSEGALFTAQRDIVLIELRGLHYSEPTLGCPGLNEALVDMLGLDLESSGLAARQQAAVRACRTRLLEEGVDLSAYNSAESTHDIALAMTALGYERFNVYANSAGTRLAQSLMRAYPERLRAVVLASVVPIDQDLVRQMPRNAARALRLIFERCAADPACDARFPDLEQKLQDLMAQLERQPWELEIRDPRSGRTAALRLTPERLARWLFVAMYSTDHVARLPEEISRLAAGDRSVFEEATSAGVFFLPDTFSWGEHFSFTCSEAGDRMAAPLPASDDFPEFAEAAADLPFGPGRIRAACDVWDVEPLAPALSSPVQSGVPTLLLSGELDNVTPPTYAESVARGLSRSYAYEFPGVAHSPIDAGICPFLMMAQFLEDPTRAPDDACLVRMREGRTLPEPFGSRLAVLVPSICLLLSCLLVWPLAALRTRSPRRGPRLGRVLAGTAAVFDLAFLGVFAAGAPALLLLSLFILREPGRLLEGYPLTLRLVAWLPLASLAPAAGAVVAGLQARRDEGWRPAARIYYAGVLIAAFAFAYQVSM